MKTYYLSALTGKRLALVDRVEPVSVGEVVPIGKSFYVVEREVITPRTKKRIIYVRNER